jgi:hypothetical protein
MSSDLDPVDLLFREEAAALDQTELGRIAEQVRRQGGEDHAPREIAERGLHRVVCSCGHHGAWGATMVDAYCPQIVHLHVLKQTANKAF